jgi:hypothetical protein
LADDHSRQFGPARCTFLGDAGPVDEARYRAADALRVVDEIDDLEERQGNKRDR